MAGATSDAFLNGDRFEVYDFGVRAAIEPIGKHAMPYLNRLSDALFVMARYENHQRGVAEPLWDEKA